MGVDTSRPSSAYTELYLPSDTLRICNPDRCWCQGGHHRSSRYMYVERGGDGRAYDPFQYMDQMLAGDGDSPLFPAGWKDPREWTTRDYERLGDVLSEYYSRARGRQMMGGMAGPLSPFGGEEWMRPRSEGRRHHHSHRRRWCNDYESVEDFMKDWQRSQEFLRQMDSTMFGSEEERRKEAWSRALLRMMREAQVKEMQQQQQNGMAGVGMANPMMGMQGMQGLGPMGAGMGGFGGMNPMMGMGPMGAAGGMMSPAMQGGDMLGAMGGSGGGGGFGGGGGMGRRNGFGRPRRRNIGFGDDLDDEFGGGGGGFGRRGRARRDRWEDDDMFGFGDGPPRSPRGPGPAGPAAPRRPRPGPFDGGPALGHSLFATERPFPPRPADDIPLPAATVPAQPIADPVPLVARASTPLAARAMGTPPPLVPGMQSRPATAAPARAGGGVFPPAGAIPIDPTGPGFPGNEGAAFGQWRGTDGWTSAYAPDGMMGASAWPSAAPAGHPNPTNMGRGVSFADGPRLAASREQEEIRGEGEAGALPGMRDVPR